MSDRPTTMSQPHDQADDHAAPSPELEAIDVPFEVDQELDGVADGAETSSKEPPPEPDPVPALQASTPPDSLDAIDDVEFVIDNGSEDSVSDDDALDMVQDAVEALEADVSALSSALDTEPSDDAGDAEEELVDSLDALIADADAVADDANSAAALAADPVNEIKSLDAADDEPSDTAGAPESNAPHSGAAPNQALDDDATTESQATLGAIDETLAEGAGDAVSSVVDEAIAAAAREMSLGTPSEPAPQKSLDEAVEATAADFERDIEDARSAFAPEMAAEAGAPDEDPFVTSDDVIEDVVESLGVEPPAASEAADEVPGDETGGDETGESGKDDLVEAMASAALPTETIEVADGEPTDDTPPVAAVDEASCAAPESAAPPRAESANDAKQPDDSDQSPAPAQAKPDMIRVRLRRIGFQGLIAVSAPVKFVPPAHRGTLGWVSINTMFLGAGFLVVALMGRGDTVATHVESTDMHESSLVVQADPETDSVDPQAD